MPEITATVVAKSEYGIKVEQDGPWWNWSKVEYRSEPFNTEVQKGDRVQITYAETDGGKTYITAIDKVTGQESATGLVQGAPFPPDEDFPPDATSEPVAPVLDTNRLIVRQVTAKCAVEALGQYPLEGGDAQKKYDGALLYLMSYIEDLVYRE